MHLPAALWLNTSPAIPSHKPLPFSNPFSPFILSVSHRYMRNSTAVMLILKVKKLTPRGKNYA